MALSPGRRLGPYEIVALAGSGGMGEVYRARDTRLGRTVALKVIGSGHDDNPERRLRFENEARLAAQLDHPRIGAVFDVGHHEGVDYFVMEFVEGSSLAARIGGKPLKFAELIGSAIEIAAALAYAHARGVEHRDLKPSNILLTPSGVKVIDFGIARRRWNERRPSDNLAAMKTAPIESTDWASAPGSVGYLSPERLQGQPSDHRSDIFAFGLVLYEMAAGRRAFDADTPAGVATAILTAEPPPLTRDESWIAELEWVIRRCLRKVPDERWQSMADVEAVLKRIAQTAWRATPARVRLVGLRRLAVATLVLAIAGLALSFVARQGGSENPPPQVEFMLAPPPGNTFTATGSSSAESTQLAVSPDGRSVAFVATGSDHVRQIWVRALNSSTARPIPGTLDAVYPFWSPSSRSIGFFSQGELKRVDLDGGPVRSLASVVAGRGGTWSESGTILFSPEIGGAIYRLDADGALHQQTVLSSSRQETSHRWPQFLPDGRHFIYFARSADEAQSGIRLASLDAPDDTVVVRTNAGAIYAPSGHLLYVADDQLLAASFDVDRGRLMNDAVTLVEEIATSSSFYGAFSVSNDGVLAYATSGALAELVWVGRDGARLGVAGPPGQYVDFRLSPSNRYLVVAEVEPGSDRADLRMLDLVRGGDLRLTTAPATDATPVWSPDGSRLAFRSNRVRQHDLYIRPAGAGLDELFLRSSSSKYPTDWSPDGAYVVYHSFDSRTGQDLWAAPVADQNAPRPLVQTEFDEIQGVISPSGRWIAYTSNQSSRFEVVVEPLPANGAKWPVSTGGGSDPQWRGDEKELFYVASDGRLMSVGLKSGTSFDPDVPRPLFPLHDGVVSSPYLSSYDVSGDGQRFLVRGSNETLQGRPIYVVVPWSIAPRVQN